MRWRGVAGVVLVAALSASCKKSDEPAAAIAWPPPRPLKEGLPTFKVGGQDETDVSIVVDKGTSRDGLRALVLAFRTAREENRFRELIPPTTPKGNAGPYAIVNIYVMDDPTWANAEHLRIAVSADVSKKFEKEFAAHTLATYGLNQIGSVSELGGLGANNGGKTWEKLFSAGI
jgi:hypothetical protein